MCILHFEELESRRLLSVTFFSWQPPAFHPPDHHSFLGGDRWSNPGFADHSGFGMEPRNHSISWGASAQRSTNYLVVDAFGATADSVINTSLGENASDGLGVDVPVSTNIVSAAASSKAAIAKVSSSSADLSSLLFALVANSASNKSALDILPEARPEGAAFPGRALAANLFPENGQVNLRPLQAESHGGFTERWGQLDRYEGDRQLPPIGPQDGDSSRSLGSATTLPTSQGAVAAQPETAPLAARWTSLLNAFPNIGMSDIDRGVREFLNHLEPRGEESEASLDNGGLSTWLMAGALATAACELARRQLRMKERNLQRERRDDECFVGVTSYYAGM